MRTLVGGCRCGHIRYEITEQPWFGFACHCTDCQQLKVSAFSLGITVPESGFRLVQNRPQQMDQDWIKRKTKSPIHLPELLRLDSYEARGPDRRFCC
jgi:hypothetical protein